MALDCLTVSDKDVLRLIEPLRTGAKSSESQDQRDDSGTVAMFMVPLRDATGGSGEDTVGARGEVP